MSSFSSRGKYILTVLIIGGLLASSLFMPVAQAEFITNFHLPSGRSYDVSVTAPDFNGVFLVEVDDPDNPSQMCIRPVLKAPSTGIMALGDNTLVTYNASGTLHFSWGTVGISDATVTRAIWTDVLRDAEGPIDVWFSVSRWCVSPQVFYSIFGSDFAISERYLKLNTDGDVVYRWLGFYLPATKYVWHPDSPPEVVENGEVAEVHWPYVALVVSSGMVSANYGYGGMAVYSEAAKCPSEGKRYILSWKAVPWSSDGQSSVHDYLVEIKHIGSYYYVFYIDGVQKASLRRDSCVPLNRSIFAFHQIGYNKPSLSFDKVYTPFSYAEVYSVVHGATLTLPGSSKFENSAYTSSDKYQNVIGYNTVYRAGSSSWYPEYWEKKFTIVKVIETDISTTILGGYSESDDIPSSLAGGSVTGTTTDIGQTATSTGTLLWDDLWTLVKGLSSWFSKFFSLFASIANSLFSLADTVLSAFADGISWLAGVFADLASAPAPWNIVLSFAFAVPVLAVLYHLTHHFLRLVVQIIAAIWL